MHKEFSPDLWVKSSYSDPEGQCVEIAQAPDAVGIRDTKNRQAGHLTYPAGAFASFIRAVKDTDGWRS